MTHTMEFLKTSMVGLNLLIHSNLSFSLSFSLWSHVNNICWLIVAILKAQASGLKTFYVTFFYENCGNEFNGNVMSLRWMLKDLQQTFTPQLTENIFKTFLKNVPQHEKAN